MLLTSKQKLGMRTIYSNTSFDKMSTKPREKPSGLPCNLLSKAVKALNSTEPFTAVDHISMDSRVHAGLSKCRTPQSILLGAYDFAYLCKSESTCSFEIFWF